MVKSRAGEWLASVLLVTAFEELTGESVVNSFDSRDGYRTKYPSFDSRDGYRTGYSTAETAIVRSSREGYRT